MKTFFLPLGCGSSWNNNELKYLLRSLDKNFTEEFEFFVYADPGVEVSWLCNVKQSTHERWYPGGRYTRDYENFYSVLYKVYKFVNSGECPEEFIYIYDDVILLRESSQVRNLIECSVKRPLQLKKSKHGRTIFEALKLSNGKNRYEHHLPVFYNRDKLRELFNRFPLEDTEVPYALATLYFNLYGSEDESIMDVDYKAGFEGFGNRIGCYEVYSEEDVDRVVQGKTWMNYNDFGLMWKPPYFPLQKWITKNFKNKSRYEK